MLKVMAECWCGLAALSAENIGVAAKLCHWRPPVLNRGELCWTHRNA